ncbi:MAG: ABC transporter ATP-binding protein [Gammaproteobacteria bacterium]|nr:ABC transporter ATP-binding protein [Gammaproteobacteria bacterium]
MSTEREAVIRVQDLVTHYGDRQILKGVSLDVYSGEIMVIMGGSGSGKSTFLRFLLGLHVPTAGRIELLGQDITQLDSQGMYALRKKMGVSFQGGALFNSMSVGENVQLPLREHTDLDDATIEIMSRLKLELVNLGGFDKLMPAQLSGGMVKRAALARAIAMDPRLLFFDEPSAGLDPVVSAELDELILKLRDALNMTIVVVTHELDSAFKIADRITVLDQGQILLVGSVDEVRNSDNVRVQDLLNRRPRDEPIDPDAYMARLTSG